MIKVGVNEGVVISKAEYNDKNTLVITLREIGQEVTAKKEMTAAEMMMDGGDTSGDGSQGETNFLIFRPQMKEFDDADKDLEPAKILENFLQMKNQLSHFLKRFMTDKAIKWAPFAGVPLNAADPNDVLIKIADPIIAETVYKNYTTDFIKQITPFLNLDSKPARLFLYRKSVASHFGVLRKRFLENQPFFEGTEVPIENSKMYTKLITSGKDKTTQLHEGVDVGGVIYVPKFSSYELEKGLDNPDKVDTSEDQAGGDHTAGDIAAVEGLFSADGGAGAAPAFELPTN